MSLRKRGCTSKITLLWYDTALNEVESPVITWVQALRSYLSYLEGVSYVENQGFSREARAWSRSRDFFPVPRPQDGTLDLNITLALPAAEVAHALCLLRILVLLRILILRIEGAMLLIGPPVPEKHQTNHTCC